MKKKIRYFQDRLKEDLKDPEFQKHYFEELFKEPQSCDLFI